MTNALQRREQGEIALATPREKVAAAKEQAEALMEIVEAKGLFSMFSGKKYLEAEAWQTIVAFDDACPVPEWTREMKDAHGEVIGYIARVNITKNGEVIAAGEMSCGFEEFPCRGKTGIAKHRAAMSAAQTWAGAKAARMKYAWVAVLAGYQPTPAAEMRQDDTETTEVAERGFCLTHKVPFQHRYKEASANDKGYDFWACPTKLPNGKWCQERPSEIEEAIADVTAQDARSEAPAAKPPSTSRPAASALQTQRQGGVDLSAEFRRESARLQMTADQLRDFMSSRFPDAHTWTELSETQKQQAVDQLRLMTNDPDEDLPF